MNTMKYTDGLVVLASSVGVAGRYRMRVYRPDGRCRHDTGWFDNIITDDGLDNLAVETAVADACQVGSGTTAPTAGDTGLVSYVAGTDTRQSDVLAATSTAPFYTSQTVTYRFAVGTAAGNLSEVAVGTATTGGTLFSRALITDGAGNPTTVTVLADEFLDVTYQLQVIPPTTDSTFDITDSGPAGTVHSFVMRAANASEENAWNPRITTPFAELAPVGDMVAYDGSIAGGIDGSPTGDSSVSDSGVPGTYTSGTFTRTGTATFGLDKGNFGSGISAVLVRGRRGAGQWQASVTPAIPKANTDTLTIAASTSWTRTTAL